MTIKIGTRVRITKIEPEDKTVAEALAGAVGKEGLVETEADISGSFWVEFTDGSGGGVFYEKEVEVLAEEEVR